MLCQENAILPHYFISSLNIFHPRLQGDVKLRLVTIVHEKLETFTMLTTKHEHVTFPSHYIDWLWIIWLLGHCSLEECQVNVYCRAITHTVQQDHTVAILKLTERSDFHRTMKIILNTWLFFNKRSRPFSKFTNRWCCKVGN